MMKVLLGFLLACAIVTPLTAADDNTLVRFDGGIGVIPVSNVTVNATTGAITVSRNNVRGVDSAGQIWTIRGLKADVGTDGRISVRGKGLLLAGGNNIGTNAGASVFATLICEPVVQGVLPTQRNTSAAGVPLEPNGDFQIDDMLDPAPIDCASPVLLIRNAVNRAWFAAGILKLQD